MDFSKLDQNERLAVFGSIAVFLAGLISNWGGLLFLAILAAVGMVIVVFLPQFSPSTSLPGSKGSLMAALGFVAAGSALITLLQWIGFLSFFGLNAIMFLVALIGALVMAWAGWQELQAEGGKWQFRTSGAGAAAAPPAQAERTETPAAEAHEAHEAHEHAAHDHDEPVHEHHAPADQTSVEERRTET